MNDQKALGQERADEWVIPKAVNPSGIHRKLMAARIALQNKALKKSGINSFAKYQYFELGDFLPTVQLIFSEIGLCGTVSYTANVATLMITDVDNGEFLYFTSPMGSAALKGCHEVQNIGAVETYQRRYLWITAMEIVEHDALDSTTNEVAANSPVKCHWTDADFDKNFPKWREVVISKRKTTGQIIAIATQRFSLSPEQKERICAITTENQS